MLALALAVLAVAVAVVVLVCDGTGASAAALLTATPLGAEPAVEPESVTTIAGVRCSLGPSCAYFGDVLLVVKLNPVRLLWLDLLLPLYGAGFPHIVFFSSLHRSDAARRRYVVVGPRRVKVHLLDDNTGFCDHAVVAEAMRLWPGQFAGYLFLSDDVLLSFWQLVGLDKRRVWKQRPTSAAALRGRGPPLSAAEVAAIAELRELRAPFDVRERVAAANPPFAATSGVYYVPATDAALFQRISAVLLRHRTYNEWGTPILLRCLRPFGDDFVALRGTLVWGRKRLLQRRVAANARSVWFHPVRATSELFARVLRHVRTTAPAQLQQLPPPEELFGGRCFNCATHADALRRAKGLYHSCVAERDERCGPAGRPLREFALRHWPALGPGASDGIGGRVVVPPERAGAANPFELDHEGFWGANVTRYVFRVWLPRVVNRTHFDSPMFRGFPQCCSAVTVLD